MVNTENNKNGKLARALYTNSPEAKNELFFRKGDILTVIEFDYQGQAGWWLCTLFGDRGICPGNYLEILKDNYLLHEQSSTGEDDVTPLYDVPKSYDGRPRSITNPLDLYDVPKNHLPIYNSASVVRSKKHGSNASNLSTGSSNRVSSASSASSSVSAQSTSSSSESNSFPIKNNEGILRVRKQPSWIDYPIYANDLDGSRNEIRESSSILSNPLPISVLDSTDIEYDIPRPSLASSRPQSSLSAPMSGSRSCINIEKSESKDSIDMYDVPRSVKNCVSIFENKYDQVQHRSLNVSPNRRDEIKRSSICSSASSSSSSNRELSIEKHFGVILRNAGSLKDTDSIHSGNSKSENPIEEDYDVPASSYSRNSSVRSWSANASRSSNMNQSAYDIPAEFSRQVSICGSTETLSCPENFGNSTSNRGHLMIHEASATSGHFEHPTAPVEVKILPLCPKAAVTVCEKLRQEVITSIHSILNFVKPKWRVKDNLKEIMPELRFGCVRLNLGVKDFTDFCSRAVSNAKKFGLEPLVIRLQKLLAPLTNASQIVQRDVDELEAYLWSIDRLSIPAHEKEEAGDALDQLVLCARGLQYDVTEIANFIGLNSSALFQDTIENQATKLHSTPQPEPECTVEDIQDDYDYVTLSCNEEVKATNTPAAQALSAISNSLDSTDQQILDFYSAQIASTAPLLSQSISTFISSVHQNDPPKVFNGHLKYIILLAYKMLFAGDTIHRNLSNAEIKIDVETKSDELHRAVVGLHEASKIATRDFPKILPMQNIIDHVWGTTSAAAQLKKVILNATL